MGKYDDIINLPHHVSKTRPHMSMHDRAAQFSAFKALTGYDDEVKETARLTDSKIELTEEDIRDLNLKIQVLKEYADTRPFIFVEYFIPDKKKSGGAYVTTTGNFRHIDEYAAKLILTSGDEIRLNDIYSIEGEIFDFINKTE